jgi:hypothetical protein
VRFNDSRFSAYHMVAGHAAVLILPMALTSETIRPVMTTPSSSEEENAPSLTVTSWRLPLIREARNGRHDWHQSKRTRIA